MKAAAFPLLLGRIHAKAQRRKGERKEEKEFLERFYEDSLLVK
jgi:hypothetical protein